MKTMIEGLRATGARVVQFDDVEWSDADKNPARVRQLALLAKSYGAEIVPSRAILNASPEHNSFRAMDGIHMREPDHRIMSILWLKAILQQ